ncbi:hypothetical protein SARC_05205 [Sphaeroforma arctica JP610]|uniref:Casein kinase substrate phosphoprotein PP28 domain-containing protein n=1 Tax=Sphaeroforma arctica JP610 TaxID=667725 RepID=A0A0L0G0B0_9EUKA|nr:hypothetical protein SARC_05205 [Sphaeroforma arctica JP610]KNC82505.1 hypothetical protein SARC_05205 [Sphaeroforma arctica JP610]|eukprot:XP_014156407.1 hypothetical protein SARC_05205 [Sphaeroforma arctica JP610]
MLNIQVAPKAEVYEVKGNWNQLQVPSDSESDYSSSSEDDMYNPTQMKGITKKAGAIDLNAKPQLSRREREEIEKQRDARRYQQLHAAGKTDEAQSDMARLEQIRKKRAEDAARRAMYEDDKEEEIANKKKALKGKK